VQSGKVLEVRRFSGKERGKDGDGKAGKWHEISCFELRGKTGEKTGTLSRGTGGKSRQAIWKGNPWELRGLGR